MKLDTVSDHVIREEYIRRFAIPSGAVLPAPERVVDHLRQFFAEDPYRECFVVIFLNSRNAHLATEVLFQGSLSNSAVYPREVVRKALLLGAAAVVIAHNHPSGNLNPSQEDLKITRRLKEALALVEVILHDHILVCDRGFYSFAEHDMM
jgi:DNA repair protein RadC